ALHLRRPAGGAVAPAGRPSADAGRGRGQPAGRERPAAGRREASRAAAGRGMTSPRVASRVARPREQPRPEPASRPPLRVVPDGYRTRRARRRRARALGLLASILAVAVLLGVVAFHVVLTQGQLQLDRVQQRVATEEAREQRLRL